MDGKLLVLCSERQTIDQYGNFLDEKGNTLRKNGDCFVDGLNNEVKVDTHKRIINATDLILPMETESTQHSDIIFADWESVVPSDIQELYEMVECSMTQEMIPQKFLLGRGENQSLMKKAHLLRLLECERPSIDYRFQAMDDFFSLLSSSIQSNMIVSVLPAFSKSDSPEVTSARLKVWEAFKNNYDIRCKINNNKPVDLLPVMNYENFGELYSRAQDEMLKIMSKPYFFEEESIGEDEGAR